MDAESEGTMLVISANEYEKASNDNQFDTRLDPINSIITERDHTTITGNYETTTFNGDNLSEDVKTIKTTDIKNTHSTESGRVTEIYETCSFKQQHALL